MQAAHRKHRELLLEVEAGAIALASRAHEIETSGCRPDARRRKVTAALVASVEAWAVAVLPGTQETPVILKTVLLAASASASAGE